MKEHDCQFIVVEWEYGSYEKGKFVHRGGKHGGETANWSDAPTHRRATKLWCQICRTELVLDKIPLKNE